MGVLLLGESRIIMRLATDFEKNNIDLYLNEKLDTIHDYCALAILDYSFLKGEIKYGEKIINDLKSLNIPILIVYSNEEDKTEYTKDSNRLNITCST